MKKSSGLLLFLTAIMLLFAIKFFLIKSAHNEESKLSEEFVEYGKYDELRNSVPLGGWEQDTVIDGMQANETNIIRRKNYFEINTSIPESNLKVFIYSTESDDGLYFNNLTLETNKKKAATRIGTLTKYDNNRIYFADLNRDGRKEICFTTDQGGGTGLNIYRLHVFDSESLEEYKIEDPVSYVESLYTFEETEDGIHLKVEGKDYYASLDAIEKNYKDGGINSLQNVGNYENVYIQDGMVRATILRYYGVFNVFYKFEDKMFKIERYEVTF